MMIKKIFSGRAGRIEFSIYFFFEIIAQIIIFYLSAHTNLDDETIIYMFYIYLIFLIPFIPIQAVTTRRLRDLKINGGWIFFNFIPGINFLFKIYLSVAKGKEISIEK